MIKNVYFFTIYNIVYVQKDRSLNRSPVICENLFLAKFWRALGALIYEFSKKRFLQKRCVSKKSTTMCKGKMVKNDKLWAKSGMKSQKWQNSLFNRSYLKNYQS